MKFLRLRDHLLSVLFEDEDIVAIDKPYGFNAHTNDSKIEHSEFIQDGLIEIYEKNFGKKLHIVHRLDQTTTGVMIFGRSVESAKKYAEFFFHRQVKKTYWFLTKSKSSQASFRIDEQIVHKGRELDAETQLTLLKKSPNYELWQANPFQGRNHQIRIHAKAAGIPILGDEKYTGAIFPFLCLHNHKIEFPNGIKITSEAPAFYEDMGLLGDATLTRALFEADRRLRLFSAADVNQCFRLVHTQNNSPDLGFTLDQFGKVLVLNWFKEHWGDTEVRKFTYFSKSIGKPILVRMMADKGKPAADKSQIVIYPTDSSEQLATPWIGKEDQVQYELRADAGSSVGIYLNQRLQRSWVRRHSSGKSVLNLFSYTCGFGLAAALGQAEQVTSVDMGKGALNWGRKNFELNFVDIEKHKFFCRDSFTFLEQCQAKDIKYDLIICDTPSFMKREKKLFKIKADLEGWLKTCLSCLNPQGELILSTNFDGFFVRDIEMLILKAQKSLQIPNLEISCILSSLDFELPDEKTSLKSFLIRLGN
jgi:23S rRNA (cytosine1962-C5)-methyltransferase